MHAQTRVGGHGPSCSSGWPRDAVIVFPRSERGQGRAQGRRDIAAERGEGSPRPRPGHRREAVPRQAVKGKWAGDRPARWIGPAHGASSGAFLCLVRTIPNGADRATRQRRPPGRSQQVARPRRDRHGRACSAAHRSMAAVTATAIRAGRRAMARPVSSGLGPSMISRAARNAAA